MKRRSVSLPKGLLPTILVTSLNLSFDAPAEFPPYRVGWGVIAGMGLGVTGWSLN